MRGQPFLKAIGFWCKRGDLRRGVSLLKLVFSVNIQYSKFIFRVHILSKDIEKKLQLQRKDDNVPTMVKVS